MASSRLDAAGDDEAKDSAVALLPSADADAAIATAARAYKRTLHFILLSYHHL